MIPIGDIIARAYLAARLFDIDVSILLVFARIESNFDDKAHNAGSGASGLYQYVRGTASEENIDPLNVPEAIMIEPTETEDRDTLDNFVAVLEELIELARTDPDKLRQAPISTPVGRLDEVKAARDMRLSYT